MNQNEIKNSIVKECLTDALFMLMEKKKFDKISITELCEKAGVSRLSFYRNYNSKEDIIVKYLDNKANIWWNRQLKDSKKDIILGMFKHFYKEKDKLKIIYKSELSHLLYQNILNCTGPKNELSDNEAYSNGWISGGIFGFLDEWIKRGFIETPEELTDIFNNKQKYYTNSDIIDNNYRLYG
ncbi:MAG: TetR/AcrR family transcriptional regulator [Lachnospiraceae bacterium]|nr:TetR/AcrR family transcriptional regulator [Lachnospiraceae bacterium]